MVKTTPSLYYVYNKLPNNNVKAKLNETSATADILHLMENTLH